MDTCPVLGFLPSQAMLQERPCLYILACLHQPLFLQKKSEDLCVDQHYEFILLKSSVLVAAFNISKCIDRNWASSAIGALVHENMNFLSV